MKNRLATFKAKLSSRIKSARAKKFLDKIQKYDKAEFEGDLYEAQTFIPYKYRSTLENIRSNFEESYGTARKERDGGDHLGATLSMTFIFFKLFYYNNVSDDISNLVADAMVKASGQPWNVASGHLWGAMEMIMSGNIGGKRRKSPKDFSVSLFGK